MIDVLPPTDRAAKLPWKTALFSSVMFVLFVRFFLLPSRYLLRCSSGSLFYACAFDVGKEERNNRLC